MAAIDLGDVEDFPFLDPPDKRQVRDGIALLQELNALDETGRKLTPLGRQLAALPIDPRMGRMVLEADRLGCVEEVIVIAAALSIQDVASAPPTSRPRPTRRTPATPTRLRLPRLSESLALPAREARRAVGQPVPQAGQGRVPALPADPRVAGPRRARSASRPRASGSRSTTRTPSRR